MGPYRQRAPLLSCSRERTMVAERLALAADHCDAWGKMECARWPLGPGQILQVVDDLQDAASHIDAVNSIRYPAVVGMLRGVRLEGEVPHTITQPRGRVLVHLCRINEVLGIHEPSGCQA